MNPSKPTIGADFSKKELQLDSRTKVTLQIWDTAGQEKFQSLGYAFYRGADCCCLCYDITNRRSFENLNRWREQFMINAAPDEEDQVDFPILVMGNKVDREYERKVETEEAYEWCRQECGKSALFYETSAKQGLQVE